MGILSSRDFVIAVFFGEEKSENRPPPAEKTCSGYMLKHQRNCLAPVPEKPINLPSD